MKRVYPFLSFIAISATAKAQWIEENFALKAGWNAIHLQGSAEHASPEQLFGAYQIEEVWRWNTNPDELGFLESPAEPSFGTPDWNVWRKDDLANTNLQMIAGQASYLVKVADTASPFNLQLKLRAQPPRNQWLIKGGNLIGFPTDAQSPPTCVDYFTSFQEALPTVGGNDIFQ